MSKKRIIITAVSIAVVIALAGGGIGAYRWYQSNNLVAEVQSVSNLNWGYSGSEMSSSGMVTNDMYQDIYLLESQRLEEIFVEEGQTVAVGDPLLSYDMTLSNLQTDMKALDIDTYSNKLAAAKQELEKLKKTTPIAEGAMPNPVPDTKPELPEMTGDAYNYISPTAVPGRGTGTVDDPFIFLCTPECYVEGGYLNSLSADKTNPQTAIFEIHQDNVWNGNVITAWRVSAVSGMPWFDEDSKWSVSTQSQIEVMPEPEPDIEIPQGYTAQELARMIAEKETEIRDLDLNKRRAELELDQMKKVSAEGVVYATVNGVIKSVGDKENPPRDGSPFLTVSGSEGLYVKGSLSELMLNDVTVGQPVYVNSWESGMSFEATITDISTFPQENSNSWGEGNPNVSYYPYTAYIEDTEGLRNGEYVDLTMTGGEDYNGGIYIEKAYVREEDGKSYVLKADEKDRLVKQYVVTGKTLWGQAVEIVSGLTLDDRIAFPYGKTAKEGIKTKEPSGGMRYYR